MEDWAIFAQAGENLRAGRPSELRTPPELAAVRRAALRRLAEQVKQEGSEK
jgi:hypothetical protein